MIECRLLPMVKNKFFINDSLFKKFGRYTESAFYSIKGYGRTCWVVVANIVVDYDHYAKKGASLEEIALQCVEYLNHRPKSRYGKKRRRKSLYGAFRPKPHLVKLLNKDGKKYVQVLLVTENRTNPNFWGEGNKESQRPCRRTRRRT